MSCTYHLLSSAFPSTVSFAQLYKFKYNVGRRIADLKNKLTPPFMGAESCERSESLQTYFETLLMYALDGSKTLRKKFASFHFRQ